MTETVLKAEGLGRNFDVSPPWVTRLLTGSGRRVLNAVDDVSFAIERGETFSLVGESGGGKPPGARLIVGLYRPTSGRIEIDGTDGASLKGRKALAPIHR